MEHPRNGSWSPARQDEGFHSGAMQGGDFRGRGPVRAWETPTRCQLWPSSPRAIPPKLWGSSISKDATALAEPPTLSLYLPNPFPPGEFGFPCLQTKQPMCPRVSYAEAKTQVYYGRCLPALRLPVIRRTRRNLARAAGSVPGHLLGGGCSAAEALIN